MKKGISILLSMALLFNVNVNNTYAKPKDKINNFMKFETQNPIGKIKENGSKFQTKRLIVEGKVDDSILSKIDEKDILDLGDGKKVMSFADVSDTKEAYDYLKKCNKVESVYGENIYSVDDASVDDYISVKSINEQYYKTNEYKANAADGSFTPDSFPRRDNLSWGSDYIKSPTLVDYINESSTINKKEMVVAVIDTGVNVDHSIFKGRIARGGRSYVTTEPTVDDEYGHGSHVAGIIVDNTPSNVKILPIKALGKTGKGSDLAIANAVDYAIFKKVDVINMSLGGKSTWTDSLLEKNIKKAIKAGISVVVGSGNEGKSADNYSPARLSECITVAASDVDGSVASFSNYGECIDVCAPGVGINSAYMKKAGYVDTYNYESGTSMATPFVASTVCMVKMMNPNYTPSVVEKSIKSHVLPIESDKKYGNGIIELSNYVSGTRCGDVVFNHLNGEYFDESSLKVELSSSTSGATIYYTTDNTNPSATNGKK